MNPAPLATCLEPLEARIAPATIEGVLVGATLKISALSPAGAVTGAVVQFDPDSFDLFDGVGAPTRFDGVRNLEISLSDANDDFDIVVGAPDHRGFIRVDTGNGLDSVSFMGFGGTSGDVTLRSEGSVQVSVDQNLAFRGNVKITSLHGFVSSNGQLGSLTIDGADTVFLAGTVAGNVKITGHEGGVDVNASGIIHGSLTVKGGLGTDTMILTGKTGGNIRFTPGDEGSSFTTNQGFGAGGSVTVIGGATAPDVVSMQLGGLDPFTSVVGGAMTFVLGGGDNSVSVTGSSRVGGGIRVSAGEGADTVNLGGLFGVGGAVQLALGGGNNEATLSNVTLFGAFRYAGSAGADNVDLLGSDVLGAAKLILGDGTNTVEAFGAALDSTFFVKGGVGNDSVSLGGATIFGRATFTLGDGTNGLNTQVSQLRGGFVYQGGADSDLVIIDAATTLMGTGAVKGGEGANALQANTLSFLTSFSYTGGAGSDTFILGTAGGAFARIKASLGDGSDTAIVGSSVFVSLRVDGGLGGDTLNRIAAAVTAGLVAVNIETTVTL